MVRFSINYQFLNAMTKYAFTFHYGQIFNVRGRAIGSPSCWKFTFHYGQIFNSNQTKYEEPLKVIYIPLWLDFQSDQHILKPILYTDLHSTMVRFSILILILQIIQKLKFTFHYGQIFNNIWRHSESICVQIYIPLWLDFQ